MKTDVKHSDTISRILNTPRPEDKVENLEQQLKSLCHYVDQNLTTINNELSSVKEALFNQVMDPKEAGKALKIKAVMVRRHLERGDIKGYKVGSRWKTTLGSVYEYMRRKPTKYGEELTLLDVVKLYQ